MITLPWGIAGHPRGATHFAAALFDVGHESVNARGICDFLLASRIWIPPEVFRHFMRGHIDPDWHRHYIFTNKLTVLRDPLHVISTAAMLRPGQVSPALGWRWPDLRLDVPAHSRQATVEYVARVMLRWYQEALAFSAWNFFRAEDPNTYLDIWLPRDTIIPDRIRSTDAKTERLGVDEVKRALTEETLEAVLDFRKAVGYE